MRGTGLVAWGSETVYAYYTTDGNAVRVRLSVDEADRFRLWEGSRVWITLPDREPVDALVMNVGRMPPFVWVELIVIAASAAHSR